MNWDPDPEFWPNLDPDPGLFYKFWDRKKVVLDDNYNCNYKKIMSPSDILTQLSLWKVNFFYNLTPFAYNLYYFYMNTGTYKSNLEDKLGVLCYKGVISKVAQGMV